jgi:POT family proton-dependent oligopeptide transporter
MNAMPRWVPKTFRDHPAVLLLAATEMWEAFSYVGLRTVLVYYLTQDLGYSTEDASLIYGTFLGVAYVTPILGGWLADRFIGRSAAIIGGALLKMAGYIGLLFGANVTVCLAAIVIGNGLFLPTLPATLGALFSPNDPDRQRSFSFYYLAVSAGALLAPLICGTLGETFGWRYSFLASATGLAAAIVIFLAGRHLLPPDRPGAASQPIHEAPIGAADRSVIPLLAGVLMAVIVLRVAYEQLGNTVALFAASQVDRSMGGDITIPYTWFQSLNPLGVILFTPLLVWGWRKSASRGGPQDDYFRMAIGSSIMAVAFVGLALVIQLGQPGQIPWPVLAAFFLMVTFGELWVLPVGLSLFARLAPAGRGAITIAFWYSARAAGNFLAGLMGRAEPALGYGNFFLLCAAFPLLAAAMFVAISRRSRRVMEAT